MKKLQRGQQSLGYRWNPCFGRVLTRSRVIDEAALQLWIALPNYNCPKCGKVGYLQMQTVKNFKRGTFSYRFRIVHASKEKRTECLMFTMPGDYFSRDKKRKKSAAGKFAT